jgi:hypothetical protein
LLLALSNPTPARAAWEFVPDLGIGAETEENPRLNPESQITDTSTATSAILSAGADIASFDERSSLTLRPRIEVYRYADEENKDLESEDLYFDGRGEYRWRTVTAGFNASYAKERLLDSELLDVDFDNDPDTDDPDSADTGRLAFITEDRERTWLSPYVSFRVSDRNSLRFEVTQYSYSYSGGDRAFRSGFDDTRFSLGINRNVDARNTVSAIMSVETYEAEGTDNKTDTVTIEGAFTRPLTQLWTLNLAAGVLRSDYEYLTNNQITDGATTDYTMRLGLRQRGERSRVNIDFTRYVYPSGSGFSSVRREFRVYHDRELTQRLDARFGVRLNETKSLGDVNVEDNREYIRAEVGLAWAWRPTLFLEGGYRYTSQDFTEDIIQQTPDSNSIFIGMNYRGLSRR